MNQRANEPVLNDEQFERFKHAYIDTIVDSMSTKDLIQYVHHDMEDFQQYVRNDMWDYLGKCAFSGVLNEIKYTLDDEMLDEFITTIKEDSKD